MLNITNYKPCNYSFEVGFFIFSKKVNYTINKRKKIIKYILYFFGFLFYKK